jgi:hypothetical protein
MNNNNINNYDYNNKLKEEYENYNKNLSEIENKIFNIENELKKFEK